MSKERLVESVGLLEKKSTGKTDVALCPSLEALAEAHYSLGAYEEAQALHQRALLDQRTVFRKKRIKMWPIPSTD